MLQIGCPAHEPQSLFDQQWVRQTALTHWLVNTRLGLGSWPEAMQAPFAHTWPSGQPESHVHCGPIVLGTQVPRVRSHAKPAVQFASAVQVAVDLHAPLAQ